MNSLELFEKFLKKLVMDASPLSLILVWCTSAMYWIRTLKDLPINLYLAKGS